MGCFSRVFGGGLIGFVIAFLIVWVWGDHTSPDPDDDRRTLYFFVLLMMTVIGAIVLPTVASIFDASRRDSQPKEDAPGLNQR